MIPFNLTAHLQQKVDCSQCRTSGVCQLGKLSESDSDLLKYCIDHQHTLKKHTHLFHQGAKLQSIYSVQSGLLKSYLEDSDGQEKIVEFHYPGDLLGMDAIQTLQHTSSAVAIQDSSVCKISWSNFRKITESCSQFQMQIFMRISNDLVHNHELLKVLSHRHVDQKLAYFLLFVSSKMEQQGYSKTDFNLGMTRDDIANFLGTASETISREFSELKQSGIIDVQRKRVKILKPDALKSIATHSLEA